MRSCATCGAPAGDAAFFCLNCGNRIRAVATSPQSVRTLSHESIDESGLTGMQAPSMQVAYGSSGVSLERRQSAGLAGVLVLFMGTFCPAFSATIFATSVSVNFLNGGRGDGRFLIGIAVVAAVFTLLKRYWFTFAGGAVALLIVVIDVADASSKLGKASALVGYDWGIGVLVLGALVMMATPFVPQLVLRTVP